MEVGYHDFGDFEQETPIDGTPADVSLSADISHYALEDADSTVFSLGIEYRFGRR
ncbi:MAG: hypothetical protein AAGA68_11160 [Pseudomonadota bacterium]